MTEKRKPAEKKEKGMEKKRKTRGTLFTGVAPAHAHTGARKRR